jgi:diguanylate cyclase (GGDEF)-like protein/PAS domain S-box-containing protein
MNHQSKTPEPTVPDTDDPDFLRAEIARLNKVVHALIDRAERSAEIQGSDFSLFQAMVMVEEQVRARTEALETALRENERVNRALTKSEAKFSAMFSLTPDPVVLTRVSDGVILDVSRSAAGFFGYCPDEVIGQTTRSGEFNIWVQPEHHQQWLEAVMRDGELYGFETSMRRNDGSIATVLVSGKIVEIAGEACVLVAAHDITERKWNEAHERLRADILEMLARGMELPALLDALMRGIEMEQPTCIASIVLVDDEGRLRTGAAPNLPDFFLTAIQGKQIGNSAAAAGRSELVIVDDIQNHPDWESCRSVAAAAGLVACWSQPVFDARGRVEATISVYARERRVPSPRDIAYLIHASNIASVAISRHRNEETLRRSEAKFSAVFRLTPDPVVLTRLRDGLVLEVSRSFIDYFGYSPDEVIGRTTVGGKDGIWVDPERRRHWVDMLNRNGEAVEFETEVRRKNGSIAAVLVSGKVVAIGGEPCVIATVHDITERKRHTERLEQIAQHDSLTGLPNRLLLGDRLQQAIAQCTRKGTRIAVCYVDLDGFKEVNDQLGHQAGDQVLIEVATRMTSSVRGGDTVARLGGDEFVILLAGLANDEECRQALDRLLVTCSAPYVVGGNAHAGVSASIGVTVFPSDNADPDMLIRHADLAMYAAKQAGKNRYQMFDTRIELRIKARLTTLRQLTDALSTGQFELHYQPKVDCRRGVIIGAEALIRWNHPTLGQLYPAAFVPLMENCDLAHEVGNWVLHEVIAQIVRWRKAGFDMVVSVNAFICQLMQADFVPKLKSLFTQFPDATPNLLRIEIAETAALNELRNLRPVIEACREFGIEFSLDGFGTGYSTLAHLRHLPASEIKIDQSFVGHMLTRTEDCAIVEAVIGLGHAFGLSVVAEGAETPAHVRRLRDLGCDVMQGYALARPMAADDLLLWITEFHPNLTAQMENADAQL